MTTTTTAPKKPTYASVLAKLTESETVASLLTADEITTLGKLRDSIAKKNSSTSGKLTPAQEKNEQIKLGILEFMESGAKYTLSEFMKKCPICVEQDLSSQKINALLRQMIIDDKTVEREEIKRIAYFSKVEG